MSVQESLSTSASANVGTTEPQQEKATAVPPASGMTAAQPRKGAQPARGDGSSHHRNRSRQNNHGNGRNSSNHHRGSHQNQNTNTNQQPSNEARTLWMGSIQSSWSEAQLYNVFASAGDVVRVRLMRNATSGLPSGYAFIEFRTHAAAKHVLESLNGSPIPGTNIFYRLNWGLRSRIQSSGSSRSINSNGNTANSQPQQDEQHQSGPEEPTIESRSASSATSSMSTSSVPHINTTADPVSQPRSRHNLSLYVGDLSPETTNEVLKQAFASKYNSCVDANVLLDSNTGACKGYGFVRFSRHDDYQHALNNMQNTSIAGRRVRVGPATRRPDGGNESRVDSPRRQHMLRNMASTSSTSSSSMSMAGSSPAKGRRSPLSEASHESDEVDVTNVTHNSVTSSSSAASKSSHAITATDLSATDKIVTDSTTEKLSTDEAKDADRIDEEDEETDVDEATAAALYGGRPPPRTTVFIGNLDPKVDATAIQSHFECCGTIESIKIPPNKGCGFVKFSTREEARRAIDTLRGTMLGAQAIRLDWGKFSNNPRSNVVHTGALPMPQPIMYAGQASPSWQHMPAMFYPGSTPGAQQGAMDFSLHAAYYGTYFQPSSPPSSPMGSVVAPGSPYAGAAAAAASGAFVYPMYGAPAMLSPQHLAAAAMMSQQHQQAMNGVAQSDAGTTSKQNDVQDKSSTAARQWHDTQPQPEEENDQDEDADDQDATDDEEDNEMHIPLDRPTSALDRAMKERSASLRAPRRATVPSFQTFT